ncbi:hypothetical protein BCR36DRAFT_397156 [Piromyces finnis]|uniref:Transglutaminase-like domain-containing protein n=1 Tax=Piromyces finnis TaxID=1754191 RepID=A0A1Y1VAN2_9FUNG|nr:hypothetical protein BCR36DRAFT_397156 [Piromyces finnis]|eukprot:ORX51422.1 hypothetical protein BCR36DRAFT_397156 [Piromyces finnis]
MKIFQNKYNEIDEIENEYNEILYDDYERNEIYYVNEVFDSENENEDKDRLIFKSKKLPIKFWEDNEKEEFYNQVKQNITKSNDNDEIIDITIASTNFTFYDQLTSNEKSLYDIILKASTKEVPKVNIKVLVKGVTNLEKYIADITISAEKLFTVLVYEHPELWWIGNYQISIYETDDINNYTITFILLPEGSIFYEYTKDKISQLNSEIKNIKNEIIYQIDYLKLKYPYSIIKYIHDYLIIKIEYVLDEERKHLRTLYGALVENKCVCEGYAEAFQYLVQQYGINCLIARSSTHEWNFIELNDKWYVIDVTFDDPLKNGQTVPSGSGSNIKSDYFLIGTEHSFKTTKYSDEIDHILTYSAYSNQEMVYYPNIEKNDYIPSNLELQELNLIDYSNITNGI